MVMKQFNLEEYLKNPSKKVVTRDGRNVRIICTDAKGNYPVVGLVDCENSEVAFNITKDGRIDSVLDLVFATEKHEGWVNIYKVNNFYHTEDELVYNSNKEAEMEGRNYMSYIATVKIEWEE